MPFTQSRIKRGQTVEADRRVAVERLSNLGDWEMYRFADEMMDNAVCRVALRPDGESIEYGIWRKDDAEPSATGKLEWDDDDEWGNEAREAVLARIASIYADGLPEVKKGLAFHIAPLDEDDEDDGDDDDEDDDDVDEEDVDDDDGEG